jgi:hypothetical protein
LEKKWQFEGFMPVKVDKKGALGEEMCFKSMNQASGKG